MRKNNSCFALVLGVLLSLAMTARSDGLYDSGVQSYLKKDFGKSMDLLERAIVSGDQTAKSSKLLKKVYWEAIDTRRFAGDSQEAYELAVRAAARFPAEAQFAVVRDELMASAPAKVVATAHVQRVAPTPVEARSKRSTQEKLRQAPVPAVRPQVRSVVPAPPLVVAAPPVDPAQSVAREAAQASGVGVWVYFAAGAAALTFLLQLVFYSQAKGHWKTQVESQQSLLGDQMKLIEERFRKEEQQRLQLVRESEAKDRELRFKEQEIERLKKRLADGEVRKAPIAPEPSRREQVIEYHGSKIKDILIAMTGEAKENSWQRVVAQILELNASVGEAAVPFFKEMAADANPSLRAGMVRALRELATPAAFEILYGMREDVDIEVKREVMKAFKSLLMSDPPPAALDEVTKKKISDYFADELTKAQWVV
ncbi:MAG: hypothetical protein AABZ44_04535 [Elusimicrobiota bacterium]